jgi:O-antigen/teichoic acid export membrane protein
MISRALYYALSRTCAGVSYLFCSIIILKNIGIENYGLFSIALVSAQTIAFITSTWVGLAAVRKLPGLERDSIHREISIFSFWSVSMSLLSGMILWILNVVGFLRIDPSLLTASLLFCIVSSLHENQMYMLNARQYVKQYSASVIIRYLGGFALTTCALSYFEPTGRVALFCMGIMTFLALLTPTVRRQIKTSFLIEKNEIRHTFFPTTALGLPSIIIFGLLTYISFTNRFILNWLGNTKELGIFSSITDLVNGPTVLLFQIITLAWTPSVMGAANRNDAAEFKSTSKQFQSMMILPAIPGAIALWLTGPGLIALLTSGSISGRGTDSVGWIALNSILICLFGVGSVIIIAAGRATTAATLAIGTVVANAFAVIVFGGDSLSTAQSGSIAIGLGTVASMFVTFAIARTAPDIRYILAASVSAIEVWLSQIALGPSFFSNQPISALALAITFTAATCLGFNVAGVQQLIADKLRRPQ